MTKKSKKGEDKMGGSGGGGARRSGAVGGTSAGAARQPEERDLPGVPGQMFSNGASDAACLHTQQGTKGTNQDDMIVWENFLQRSDTVFCGVFDGHGPFGHMVARKVRETLPLKLSNYLGSNATCQGRSQQSESWSTSMNYYNETASVDDCCGDLVDLDEKEKIPDIHLPLKKSFMKAFKSMDKELKCNSVIDCVSSGSTAVILIKQGQNLMIGNLGDSRAIMATRDKDNNLVAVQLTTDLTANLPGEASRIQQCGGRVFAVHDEPEVSRVWSPNNDSPGLAMARAFGDFCLKDYGLISIPDVSYRQLSEKDEFIILASDGVWDVLSNKEVIDIVASAPTRGVAARALVDYAVRTWRLKSATSKIDDCTVVCLFLQPSNDRSVSEKKQKSPSHQTADQSQRRNKGDKPCQARKSDLRQKG